MSHPLIVAVQPLLDRIGAVAVPPQEQGPGDVPLVWYGEVVAAVRLPTGDLSRALQQVITDVEAELGGRLSELPRAEKQRAVRLLEERGAFTFRKSVETVAQALGVSRFTVYNYLNRADDT